MTWSDEGYSTLRLSARFLIAFADRQLTAEDRSRIMRALGLLDVNERHPSLRVHGLSGTLRGTWSASASDSLRITFRRLPGGTKLLIECTKHYDR